MVDKEEWFFRLYIAGEAPNSRLAKANLAALCRDYQILSFSLELVDILVDPQRALADGILLTPTLVRVNPLPLRIVVGNLSESIKVAQVMGMVKKSDLS
jgi:circadian clock protein KaiB